MVAVRRAPLWRAGFRMHRSTNLRTATTHSLAALAQASDLLRCAVASASEAGDGLCGLARDRVLSVMHLVELARAYVDKSLDGVAMH